MLSGVKARKLALEVLIKIERHSAYANLALDSAFKRKTVSERDRAFVTALVHGISRHRTRIDDLIGSVSSKPLTKLPYSLRNLLRLAFFQLEYMPDIPQSAILNTSTELAKITGHIGQAKFTNGILRSFLRQAGHDVAEKQSAHQDLQDVQDNETALEPDHAQEIGHGTKQKDTILNPKTVGDRRLVSSSSAGGLDRIAELSLAYSFPPWLIERWLRNFGESETIELLRFADSPPKLSIRTNELAITPEGLEAVLKSKGIDCHPSTMVSSCIIIDKKLRGSPDKLPGFKEGLFAVQDDAAAFVSLACDPRPGQLVIDLCAAPGGKALHLAELMQNKGRVVAVDQSAVRLNLIKENRTRLGLTNIELAVADGREFYLSPDPNLKADIVLVDAPCTGTGVIHRKADIRYRKEANDIADLTELQRQLLAHAACLVKPDGILVYATCSIEPEENFDNIRWFLNEFSDFEGDDLSPFLPLSLRQESISAWAGPACKTESEMTRAYMIQLLPSRHGVSGFFVSRLRKKMR